jgi:hypothetical protein
LSVALAPIAAEATTQSSPALPVAPVEPAPEVIVTRLNAASVDALTNTAMLDSPGFDGFAFGA